MYTYPPGFSKDSVWGLLVFFLVSLIFHGILLFIIPNFLSVNRIQILPVIYMKPLEVKLRKLPPLPAKTTRTKKARKPTENEESSQVIKKKVQAISLGKGLYLPSPSIQLPSAEIFSREEKIKELYTSKKKMRERLGTTRLSMGIPNLLPDITYESSSLSSPKAEEKYTEGLIKELKNEIHSEAKKLKQVNKKGSVVKKRLSNVRLGVEGPVSERRILFRPPVPIVSTDQSVRIKLKFWVAPNGIVDQIIPVERGGTNLEAVAIGFLKRWKFEPLPASVKQERQWGILTVKFVVK